MIVNISLIMIGSNIISAPDGYDPTTLESMKEGFHLLQPKHFIIPWMAHVLSTLVGALTAPKIAVSRRKIMSLLIGMFYSFRRHINDHYGIFSYGFPFLTWQKQIFQ